MALKGARLPSKAVLSPRVSAELLAVLMARSEVLSSLREIFWFTGSPRLPELCPVAEGVGSRTERTFRPAQCGARLPGEAMSSWHARVGSGSQKRGGTCVCPLATEHSPWAGLAWVGTLGPAT